MQRLAIAAFKAIDGAGMARVDFLLAARHAAILYLNEVNTIPGFTTISMYSKMWDSDRRRLPSAARSPDRARARAPRRKAAAPHEHVGGSASALGARRGGTGRAALTGSAKLAAVYRSILSAQFDRADAEMKLACPPAPSEACRVLGVVSQWWRIQIDPTNRSRDRLLNERADASIKAAEAWTRREPGNAEAWFYLAGSYAPLVQWQALRGERLGAARNGNRVREALEEALKLDASLADAQFGIGVYQYYADVAPAPAKLLRWFLFLPGGDRVKGLHAIEETSRDGDLMRDEAAFQCS